LVSDTDTTSHVATQAQASGGQPLWRDRRFARYWIGQGVSQLGDRVTELALPIIAVVALHAGATTVGLLTAAVWAPSLLALFVGTWVDRQDRKRRLLVAADLLRCATLVSVPIAHVLGAAVTLGQLFAVALVTGLGQTLYQTAYPSFFVGLVARSQYVEANSLLSATRSASFVAGPAVAGGLIQALTAPVAILVDAVSFAWSALMIGGVRVEERPIDESGGEGLLRRARAGLQVLLRHPYLRWTMACSTTINFFSYMAGALLILFASRHLGLSAAVIGLALGVGAVGALVGTAIAGRVARRIGVGPTIAVGAIVFGLSVALVPLATGPEAARAVFVAAAEFFSGVGVMLYDIPNNSLQAAVTPDGARSRIAGAYTTINYGVRPIGAVAGGVLGGLIGIAPTMLIAAAGGSLAFVWLLASPVLATRTIEELEPIG
jgi:MFS family permease